MKYSFMTFSCPALALDQVLELARKYGYDGIEPRIGANHKHGLELESAPPARREARAKARDAGISFACLASSCSFADPDKTDAMIRDARRAIDLAGDIGAPRLRVFGGNFPDSDRARAIERVAGALAGLAEHARQRKVVICMETHDAWCDPEHVAEVMRRVNLPAVAVNWDIMHPVRTGNTTVERAFQVLKPWIRHVHFHDGCTPDGNTRLCPIGQGEIDHRAAVRLLSGLPYPGFLSGEWIDWEPFDIHLPRELATMKGYERDRPLSP